MCCAAAYFTVLPAQSIVFKSYLKTVLTQEMEMLVYVWDYVTRNTCDFACQLALADMTLSYQQYSMYTSEHVINVHLCRSVAQSCNTEREAYYIL